MARVLRRLRAREDLFNIWLYIAEDGGEARADRYLRRLNDVISLLAQQPILGRARHEIAKGIRSFVAESHVLLYLVVEDGIDLIRVLHGSQDIATAWAADDNNRRAD